MKKSAFLRLLLAAAAPGTSVLPAMAQEPAALVIRVQGDVEVRHGTSPSTPAAVGEPVFEGDGVIPDIGSRAILITRAGQQQVVDEETTVSLPRGTAPSDIFTRAVTTLARAASVDASMGGRQGMIRPIPGETTAVAPRNMVVVASQAPTFAWTSTPGATYDLMLRQVSGPGGVAATPGRPFVFEAGEDTAFSLPDSVALQRGATYAWTVFPGGRRGGRPVEQQEFRIMSVEESVELEDYLDQIAVFGLDPRGDGLFLTVVAYRDLGLFYDAYRALEEVEREAMLSAELYLLKGEILAELGHEAEARAAFDKADELMR
ncbi:MAG: tetratricopeptide repeat protein [Gemmatimonadetes bacterium]|nr:tetratricopeptide repeat protein [Gemmatimonadota bacterium]